MDARFAAFAFSAIRRGGESLEIAQMVAWQPGRDGSVEGARRYQGIQSNPGIRKR
jgi:hypothetical protein